MPLNALNLMYCKFHVAQIIIIKDIDNIIKGALEVFLSVNISIKYSYIVSNRMKNLDTTRFGKIRQRSSLYTIDAKML